MQKKLYLLISLTFGIWLIIEAASPMRDKANIIPDKTHLTTLSQEVCKYNSSIRSGDINEVNSLPNTITLAQKYINKSLTPLSITKTTIPDPISELAYVDSNSIKTHNIISVPAHISSAKDICRNYIASYTWMLNGNYVESMAPVIKAGSKEGEVKIYNFPWSDFPVKAFVDVESNTLTIRTQDMYLHPTYNENVVLVFRDITQEENVFLDEIVGDIREDGSIVFPSNIAICYYLYGIDAYMWGWYNCVLQPIEPFEFDASEWRSIGIAKFKDCWVTGIYGEDTMVTIPPQDVEIMKHRTIEGDYLLVNPYSDVLYSSIVSTGLVGYLETGYIRFNIADPNCCYVYPLVGSGVYADIIGNGPEEMYDYNLEGYYALKGYSTEEIINLFEANSLNLSHLDGDTVHIYNPKFGFLNALLGGYYWSGTDGQTIFGSAEITFDFANVDNITEITDVTGNYEVTYIDVIGNDPLGGNFMADIINGDSESQIIFKNFPYSDVDVSGHVNYETATITIDEQYGFYSEAYGDDVMIQLLNLDTYEFEESVTARISVNGSIIFPSNIMIGYHLASYGPLDGYFFGMSNVSMSYIPPIEWTPLGTGSYSESLMASVFEGVVSQEIPVEILTREDNYGTVYRLVNPYANWENIYEGVSFDDQRSYDMDIHTCSFQGNTYVWIENFESGITVEGLGAMSLITQTGFGLTMNAENLELYLQIYENGFGFIKDGVIMYPTFCTYNDNTYYNFLVGFSLSESYYGGNKEIAPFKVTLPQSDEEAAINAIISDTRVRYFNLQGIEVMNPTKGQLVIKQQGDKIIKTVIR